MAKRTSTPKKIPKEELSLSLSSIDDIDGDDNSDADSEVPLPLFSEKKLEIKTEQGSSYSRYPCKPWAPEQRQAQPKPTYPVDEKIRNIKMKFKKTEKEILKRKNKCIQATIKKNRNEKIHLLSTKKQRRIVVHFFKILQKEKLKFQNKIAKIAHL